MTDGNVVGPEARFIVGTGRCGSTVLSKMLDLHPSVAVLNELFSFDDAFAPYALLGAMFVSASIFGRRLWFEPIP